MLTAGRQCMGCAPNDKVPLSARSRGVIHLGDEASAAIAGMPVAKYAWLGAGLPFQALMTAVSPITKMSGCLHTLRSGSTCTRPAPSAGVPSQAAEAATYNNHVMRCGFGQVLPGSDGDGSVRPSTA